MAKTYEVEIVASISKKIEVLADSKDYEEKSCRCNKCMTVFFEDGLELLKDKDGFFKGCGVCKTDAHLMDLGE